MNGLLFQSERTRERVELVSRTDFAQPLSQDQRRLLERLNHHYGAAKAIGLNELTQRLNVSERAVKALVAELRNAPFCIPICASRSAEHGGYFLAQTHEERRHAADILFRSAQSMVKSASTLLEQDELIESLERMRINVLQGANHG